MSYWALLVFVFIAAYLITDFMLSLKRKNTINVAVIDKDGSKRVVTVRRGRDPEVDAFIKKVRAEKRAKTMQGRKPS